MIDIVLASSSPRRFELLRQLGVPFQVILPETDESLIEESPVRVVAELSRRKAADVAQRSPVSLVIAADTVVYCDRILGKPKDETDAAEMLRILSGRSHSVYSGVSVALGKKIRTEICRTEVVFRSLSLEEIRAYLKTGEGADKAGAYGIQGKGSLFVDRIDGDYFNVVGLPLRTLYGMLSEFGVDLLKLS